jgi:hypothetical protein
MESKYPCKTFQLHFCKVGRCILQTIQICEEQRTSIHLAKDIQTRPHKENGVYYEHLMNLANETIDSFFIIVFRFGFQPYRKIATTCM